MKVKILQKVKDAHRVIVQGEKGPEVVPSVVLFFPDQVIEAGEHPLLTEDRLEKLVNYGYAERVTG